MKRKHRGIKRVMALLTAAIMLFSYALSNDTLMTAKADTGGTYNGPTVNADGQVTFYYKGDGSEKSVYVKGSWNWDEVSARLYMTETDTTNHVWSVTTTDFEKGKDYEYGICAGEKDQEEWKKDPANPNTAGNCKILRNPVIGADKSVTLYYYPTYGESYPANMKVLYRSAGSNDAYQEVTMARDAVNTAIYSANFTPGNGNWEYKLQKDGVDVTDNSAKDGQTFSVVDIPEKDPTVKSPVVEGNKVTFNYYGPKETGTTRVRVAGNMTTPAWGDGAKDLTYNEKTGYWSVTLENLKAGTYEYKFILEDNNYVNDPLNDSKSGDNNTFEVTQELVTSVKSPVVNAFGTTFNYYAPSATKVQLVGDMTDWQNGALDMIKDADGWWTITIPNKAKDDYSYQFIVDGAWQLDTLNENKADNGFGGFNSKLTITGDEAGISPVVNGTSVTFVYQEDPKTSSKVRLAGDLTTPQWQDSTEEFTYNTTKKQWEYTKTVTPGSYSYKFIKDAGVWTNDPANSKKTPKGDDMLLVAGLADTTLQAEKGTATALPETVKYYAGDETEHQVKVEYSVPAGTTGVTIEDGKITVDKSVTAKNIAIDMTAGSYKATLNVTPVSNIYNYTIYYYDKNHQTTDSAELWLWENKGADGAPFSFGDAEVLSDGRTWLKATVSVSYTDMGMKARSVGSWEWEGTNVYYTNTNKDKNVTLYLVADDTTAYTELPKIVETKDRYAMIEYVRPAGDYDNWSLYTWNSGYGNDVYISLTEINGKQYFIVPIKKTTKNLSFVVHRIDGENQWAEKDGGDNSLSTPLDQTVIKAIYTQGEGITYTYPANTGHELEPKNNRVGFFYRDDDLVLSDSLKSLEGKVQVEVDGNLCDMTYDAETERFVYYYNSLTEGDHYYRFYVDGEWKLDAYNDRVDENEEYSIYTYKKYSASATAEFSTKTVDYTMNSVLKVNVENADDMVVSAVTADISALGGDSAFAIDPQLMAGTVAVNENVKAGTYTIPVVVKDQYNNEYSTSADIAVTAKTGNDFDWDEAIIYFMVTDRFYDGNTSNNQQVDKSQASNYHGGDFAGVTQKLDYLKDLGINTIWITPIVDNIDDVLTTDVAGYTSQGYHGYWAKDFTTLDPTLGTEEEFKTLINEAHSRGIKIMVDVVLNHAGYDTEDTFGDMIRSNADTVSGDDQLAPLSGMPDFATEKAEVRDQLVAWQTAWMKNYDIDYFRVDTVKHVEDTTWKAFKNSLTEANPEFKMIGEYSGAGYTFDGGQLGTGQMDSLLDFDFNDFGQQFVTGSLSKIEDSLEKRNASIDNTATLGSFLSSHDEDGLVYKLIDQNGLSEEEALKKAMVAASLQITAKGQPVIYYGEEIGLYGANNYPYQTNRYDFDWSKVTDDNTILNHYKSLLAARNAYTDVFAKGTRNSLAVSDENGYAVFERVYNGQHVVTALNITDKAQTISFDLSKKAGDEIYTNLITAGYYSDSKISGSTVTLTIPPASKGGTYMFVYSEKESVDEPIASDGDTTIEVNSDSVVTKILNTLEELLNILPLTQEEKDAILAGAKLKVELLIGNIDASVSAADKKLIEDKLKEALPGYVVGMYLDISLQTTVGELPTRNITQLDGNMKLEITVPDKLKLDSKDKTRTFAMVRIHDGKADVLKDMDNKDETITFETDRFSVYAIAYLDADTASVKIATPAKTGDATEMAGIILLGFAAVVVMAEFGRKKRYC